MFRILLITILIINHLSGAVGGNSVAEVSSFIYSVKQNGNGLVRYSTPDYSFKSIDGKNGKTYKNRTKIDNEFKILKNMKKWSKVIDL